MKELLLKDIPENILDIDKIRKQITALFFQEIYKPLILEMNFNIKVIKNSGNELVDAIRSGKIYFYKGEFKGRFNSTLSGELRRLGAKWDRTQGSWKIPQSSLTDELKNAIYLSESKFIRTLRSIDKKLEEMLPEKIADKLSVAKIFDSELFKIDKKINDQIKTLSITPKLSESARAKIAEEYNNNLKLYIKDFTQSETQKLREKIKKSFLNGERYEGLVKNIQRSYSVSANKAKFLARQESSLLQAKFKEVRYREAGSNEYIWKCSIGSPNHPVRPMHKKLDGTRQKWSSPPIVNEKGERKHPREDYGCRCSARPLIKF